jgi:translation elongation factor EF-4
VQPDCSAALGYRAADVPAATTNIGEQLEVYEMANKYQIFGYSAGRPMIYSKEFPHDNSAARKFGTPKLGTPNFRASDLACGNKFQ